MFKHIPLEKQLMEERKKSIAVKIQTEKNTADIDYLAMMSDIELDTGETEDDEIEQ